MSNRDPGPKVAVLGSHRTARVLRDDGWDVRTIESPSALAGLREGNPARLIVVGDARAGAARVEELIGKLRSIAPLVDVVVWRSNAPAAVVRAAFRGGARDVVLDENPRLFLDAVRRTIDRQRLLPQVEALSRARFQSGRFEGVFSRNEAMWRIFTTVARTASSSATVLITGETGTGKDLLARAIHRRSGRDGRFVAVNCSSIRPEIVESELFGYERGAFTGAHQAKQGLFRHADGGTLFLDEIGDMPGEAQLSLLRVLQEDRIRPLGSSHEVPINVRVVAATNAPLDNQVRHGGFREDLFYRLDVIRLEIPPLRERPEDIVYLFGHFLRTLCKRYGVTRPHLNQNFIDRLLQYDWPGNVRQLENVAERLVLEGDRERLTVRDLNRVVPHTSGARSVEPAPAARRESEVHTDLTLVENVRPRLCSLEKAYLDALLKEETGRILDTARRAGISRRTLLRKMKQHRLDKLDYRITGSGDSSPTS